MARTAFLTGISGQDSAWLAQLLLGKGYRVVGGMRRNASGSLWRLKELGIEKDVEIVPFELLELPQMMRMLAKVKPDEVYNLAAQTFVQVSFDEPLHTADVTGMGALRLIEAVRAVCPHARYYQASSSEMFGNARGEFTKLPTGLRAIDCPKCHTPLETYVDSSGYESVPVRHSCGLDSLSYWKGSTAFPRGHAALNENCAMHPRSPYGYAKLFAYWATRNAREAHAPGLQYGLYACNGILFNHESELRSEEFVTRKISMGVAKIAAGQDHLIYLGNLEAKRDWGHAKDYVEAMYLMLQQDKPDDFVIATGRTHTVWEFIRDAFACIGKDWHRYIRIDERLYRPAEVDVLIGDASKAKRVLGWEPKMKFEELVRTMVEADMRRVRDHG